MSSRETDRRARKWRFASATAGLVVLLSAASAIAGEICVSCEEPPALYACAIAGIEGSAASTPGAHLHCIRELAKSGGHARCAVDARSVAACPGTVARLDPPPPQPIVTLPPRAIAPDAAVAAPAGSVPAPAPTTDGEPPAVPPAAAPPGEPRTVEELAKRTAQSSKESLDKAQEAVVGAAKSTGQSLEKAGDAVGSVAKEAGEAVGSAAQKTGDAVGSAAVKTWRCLTSLFGDC
ncbi:MAG: antitoxin [Hyphomicrobiaceae bacterium]|nr:antitoxin [Hyphomicrobiaceae bacterium]